MGRLDLPSQVGAIDNVAGVSLAEIKVTAPPKAKSIPTRTSPLSKNVIWGEGSPCPPKALSASTVTKKKSDRRSFN